MTEDLRSRLHLIPVVITIILTGAGTWLINDLLQGPRREIVKLESEHRVLAENIAHIRALQETQQKAISLDIPTRLASLRDEVERSSEGLDIMRGTVTRMTEARFRPDPWTGTDAKEQMEQLAVLNAAQTEIIMDHFERLPDWIREYVDLRGAIWEASYRELDIKLLEKVAQVKNDISENRVFILDLQRQAVRELPPKAKK